MGNSENKSSRKNNFMQGWGLILVILGGVTTLLVAVKAMMEW